MKPAQDPMVRQRRFVSRCSAALATKRSRFSPITLLLVAVLATTAAVPCAAAAQRAVRPGRITGTVWDSTRARPLARASVQAVRADNPRSSRVFLADSLGRFRLDSLPAATYLLATFHPRLDSLGVEQIARRVVVKDGKSARARLSVPSARTLVERVCGGSFDQEQAGYVRGLLRDAERNGAAVRGTVRAEWRELTLGSTGAVRNTPWVEVDTDAQGAFVLCGVPVNSIVRVSVRTDSSASGLAELTVPPSGILMRDFFVGRARKERVLLPVSSDSAVADAVVTDTAGVVNEIPLGCFVEKGGCGERRSRRLGAQFRRRE